jgi:hypothetical protein
MVPVVTELITRTLKVLVEIRVTSVDGVDTCDCRHYHWPCMSEGPGCNLGFPVKDHLVRPIECQQAECKSP